MMRNVKKNCTAVFTIIMILALVTPQVSAAAVSGGASGLLQQMSELLTSLKNRLAGQVVTSGGIEVSNTNELMAALSTAKGGETILLAPGDYTLILGVPKQAYIVFPSVVTIASKNASDMATITTLDLRGAQNITFDRIKFDYRFTSGDPDFIRPFSISGGNGQLKNITFKNSIFDGDNASGTGNAARDGYGTAFGLGVDGRGTGVAENIILENNVFRKWLRGAVFGDTDGLVLRNNEFVDMRSDGIDFSGVSNVTIEGNYIHGFRQSSGSGDHMDMIQFWTTGVVRPNTNITIRNNWLMAEDGHWAQSIFMRNELVDTGAAGKEMYYRNVTIENNVIHNAHLHGITLGETDGVVIRNNTLLHNTAAGNEGTVNVPRISVAANATNVSVTKNIIPSPRATTEPAGFSDNLYVQQSDPTQPHYYNEYYLNALAQAQVRKHDVTVIPGSLVDRSNYGSALLKPASDFVYFTDRAGTGFNSLMHTFTAAGTNVSAATWNFGDGTTGSGLSATHTYTDAGLYTVTLTATQGSKRVTTKRTIMVQSPIMLRVNFDRDVRDTSPLGHKATITGSPKLENSALTYTTDNTQTVSYTGSKSYELLNNKQYTLAFDTRFDQDVQSGWMIYFSGTFNIAVSPKLASIMFATDTGGKTMQAALNLPLGAWHRVVMVFDGVTGIAKFFVNGVKVSELANAGSTQVGSIYHDFNLGNPFAKATPRQLDNVIFLKGAMTDAQVAAYTTNGVLPVGEAVVTLPVTTPEVVPKPTVTMNVAPTSLTTGSDTTLTWSSTNATACTASGAWSGTKLTNGTQVMSGLTKGTKTFTLTCTGTGGTGVKSVVVVVNDEVATETTPVPTPILETSSRVITTDNLNVRATPNGAKVGMQLKGAFGYKTQGAPSVESNGYSWTYVDFDNAPDGYVVSSYLANAAAVPTTDVRGELMRLLKLLMELQAKLNALLADQ